MDLDRASGVATVWLDRPDAHNALGRAFFDEVPTVMVALSDNSTVRVVVIAARGRDFSVGLDLKEMGTTLLGGPWNVTRPAGAPPTSSQGDPPTSSQGDPPTSSQGDPPTRSQGDPPTRSQGDPPTRSQGGAPASPAARAAETRRAILRLQRAINAIADCPKPVVAAIQGYCLGAGMDLVTACDIRLASAEAVFGIRETRMAITADLGTLQRLPRIVGAGHVAELALTGKDLDARRAREIGLVNEVYPDHAALLSAATSMAREIAALSPLAVQGTKAVLAANDGRTIAQALDYVATWNAGMLASDDLTEAVRAFMERRPPRFTGT